jgi:hypothetical protein
MIWSGHAKAGFVANPLQEPELDCSFARSVEVVIVHLHRILAFVESDEGMDHGLATKGNFDLVFLGRTKSGTEHHLGKLLSISDDFHRHPFALKLRDRRRVDKLESNTLVRRRGLLIYRCGAARYIRGARMGGPLQRLICTAATRSRAKLVWPRLAVKIETELQVIAIQAKDAKIPIASFWACDEFNVDFVWLGFDNRRTKNVVNHRW